MEHDDKGSDDLRTRLHAMESKLSRIRSQRDFTTILPGVLQSRGTLLTRRGRKSTKQYPQRWTNKRKSGLRPSFTKPVGMRFSRVSGRSSLERGTRDQVLESP